MHMKLPIKAPLFLGGGTITIANVTEARRNKINKIVKKREIFSFKLLYMKMQFHIRNPNMNINGKKSEFSE